MSHQLTITFYSALVGLAPLFGGCSFIDDLTCDSTESNCETYGEDSEDSEEDDDDDEDADNEKADSEGDDDASKDTSQNKGDTAGEAEDADDTDEDDGAAAVPDGAIDDGPADDKDDDTNWSDDGGVSDEFGDGSAAECAPASVIDPCLDCAAVECGEELFSCFDSSICYESCTFDCVVQTASVAALDDGLSDCAADQATRVLAKCLANTQCADKCFQ